MLKKIKKTSPAKLNLSLHVYAPRPNGYHPINSIFQTLSLSDTLHIEQTNTKGLRITSNHPDVPLNEKNILWKVYNQTNCTYGYTIHIEKNIPMGGGLGGGSSNAACFLSALNELESWHASLETLIEIGIKIGSDVPFFLKGGCAWVYGIGESIVSLPTRHQIYLLLFPNIHCDTPKIYRAFDQLNPQAPQEPTPPICPHPLLDKNDLLAPALYLYPELKKITESLTKIDGPQWYMSGSGSTLFIPFESIEDATIHKQKLQTEWPQLNMVITESL